MASVSEIVQEINTPYGWIRCSPSKDMVEIDGRLVPPWIEIDFPGKERPALYMEIKLIDLVPRLVQFRLTANPGEREVRAKDLRDVNLDEWVETAVALCSWEVVSTDEEGNRTSVLRAGPERVQEGARDFARLRQGSRRPVTRSKIEEAARIYNSHDYGGLEAIERALQVSRSTAARYKRRAVELGLIEERK